MSQTPDQVPPELLELYARLIGTHPEIELKGGVKLPYTSHNGNMFSFLTKEGTLALRLSRAEREAFLQKYNTKLCEQHGAILMEYVAVPDALLRNTIELESYLKLSFAYVQTLKPKASKKK
jgi:TfoX/Sxy family transcriptional regulator of competence genes